MVNFSFSQSSSFNFTLSVTHPIIGGLLLCAAVTLNGWYKGKRTNLSNVLFDIADVNRDTLNYCFSIVCGLLLAIGLGLEREWLDVEDYWPTLAAIHDLWKAIYRDDPAEHISHLHIPQDGPCNGLQYYAALGRIMQELNRSILLTK